jgi:hypothetical protein
MVSASEPAPSSTTTTPAVACGTNTLSSPSPPPEASAAKRTQAGVRSVRPRALPVRTSISRERIGSDP